MESSTHRIAGNRGLRSLDQVEIHAIQGGFQKPIFDLDLTGTLNLTPYAKNLFQDMIELKGLRYLESVVYFK